MLEMFQRGWVLMYPIALCSILALGIFFERIWTYARLGRLSALLARDVEELVQQGRLDEAVVVCRREPSPLARIYLAALHATNRRREHIKVLVEEVGSRETAIFGRYLGLMSTIASIAPLLGLLGTVLGMIKAFTIIAEAGVGTPSTLGGGISEALITTAAGLAVAIPTLLLHRYLAGRSERLSLELEERSLHLVSLLGE